MNFIGGRMDKLRPFIGKIIGLPVGVLCGWLAAKTGVPEFASPDTQVAIIGGIVWFTGTVTNTLVNKKANPSNAASSRLAVSIQPTHTSGRY